MSMLEHTHGLPMQIPRGVATLCRASIPRGEEQIVFTSQVILTGKKKKQNPTEPNQTQPSVEVWSS